MMGLPKAGYLPFREGRSWEVSPSKVRLWPCDAEILEQSEPATTLQQPEQDCGRRDSNEGCGEAHHFLHGKEDNDDSHGEEEEDEGDKEKRDDVEEDDEEIVEEADSSKEKAECCVEV
ncbi:hypothetical protein HPB50_010050 [Hyalomma asiaticum]|uniref:Uncharacterized protein n=1 Tax=Hyalomma asiaticum TaxID=266040 RepID=A0ACB7S2M3_HYAAI|nr:hypothetical protein HPB50_010050 [Hyalomma asiaticum]